MQRRVAARSQPRVSRAREVARQQAGRRANVGDRAASAGGRLMAPPRRRPPACSSGLRATEGRAGARGLLALSRFSSLSQNYHQQGWPPSGEPCGAAWAQTLPLPPAPSIPQLHGRQATQSCSPLVCRQRGGWRLRVIPRRAGSTGDWTISICGAQADGSTPGVHQLTARLCPRWKMPSMAELWESGGTRGGCVWEQGRLAPRQRTCALSWSSMSSQSR